MELPIKTARVAFIALADNLYYKLEEKEIVEIDKKELDPRI